MTCPGDAEEVEIRPEERVSGESATPARLVSEVDCEVMTKLLLW